MKEREKTRCDGCGDVQPLEHMAQIDHRRYCARCTVKACARICDELGDVYEKLDLPGRAHFHLTVGARSCASAIRKRGEFR